MDALMTAWEAGDRVWVNRHVGEVHAVGRGAPRHQTFTRCGIDVPGWSETRVLLSLGPYRLCPSCYQTVGAS